MHKPILAPKAQRCSFSTFLFKKLRKILTKLCIKANRFSAKTFQPEKIQKSFWCVDFSTYSSRNNPITSSSSLTISSLIFFNNLNFVPSPPLNFLSALKTVSELWKEKMKPGKIWSRETDAPDLLSVFHAQPLFMSFPQL